MLNNKQFKLLLENIQSREETVALLKKYNIENYIINDDGSIDVNENIYLNNKKLTKLPFKFGKVEGYFTCFNNKLINLDGAPKIIKGDFNCSSNRLTSLKGAPQNIEGNFHCDTNQLVNLEGAPQIIKGNFNCSYNQLINLIGAPKEVKKDFICYSNKLISLEGAPEILLGGFWLLRSGWERLKKLKPELEPEKEITLDDITDTYGDRFSINIKDFLYKDNRLISQR
jgi:hypothetical protein